MWYLEKENFTKQRFLQTQLFETIHFIRSNQALPIYELETLKMKLGTFSSRKSKPFNRAPLLWNEKDLYTGTTWGGPVGSTGLCETLLKVSHEASLTEPEPVCGLWTDNPLSPSPAAPSLLEDRESSPLLSRPFLSFPILVILLYWRPSHAILAGSTGFTVVRINQSCWTLCDPINCSTPDLPILHYIS